MTHEKHPCCQSHCCVIHGCKYGYDGTEAWADDHLFPHWSYTEGERLARQVLKWLGGGG